MGITCADCKHHVCTRKCMFKAFKKDLFPCDGRCIIGPRRCDKAPRTNGEPCMYFVDINRMEKLNESI